MSGLHAVLLTTFIAMAGAAAPAVAESEYLGQLSANPYAKQPQVSPDTLENPYGNSSNSPRLYDSQGKFRGNLNANPYDPDSVANPYGRYGSEYSPDSIRNRYGAGSEYRQDSPNNPYGQGMKIYR